MLCNKTFAISDLIFGNFNKLFNLSSEMKKTHPTMQRLFDTTKMQPAELASALDVTPQNITNWAARGISKQGAMLASARLGVDANYILTGVEGQGMTTTENDNSRVSFIPPQQTVQILPKGVHPTDTHQRIEIYDVRLAAGPEGKGSTVEWIVRPEDDPLYFRHGWFKARRLTARNLRAMYVRGDSMEPYLYNHDTIIIDTTDIELSDGEVYAIAYNGHMLVKELRATPDGVRIISRNPAYEPIEYQGGEGAPDFQIIGHVVWRGG